MRNFFFLILIFTGFLIAHFMVFPVSAYPGGDSTYPRDSCTVTVSASPLGSGPYFLGDPIILSGSNTNSSLTYLFITGPGLKPGGSRIQITDPKSRPVVDGIPDTFKAVPVNNNHLWQWQWDTTATVLESGTYTVFAVSTPRDGDHLSAACYGRAEINITRPFVQASGSSLSVTQGSRYFINGTAPGSSYPGIAIWIFGDHFSNRYTTLPAPDGSFSFRLDNATTGSLQPGTYHVIVQHPMQDKEFDIIASGYGVYDRVKGNSSDLSPLFLFSGTGSLTGADAASALKDTLSGPGVDDTWTSLQFSVKNATIVPAPAGMQPAGTADGVLPGVIGEQPRSAEVIVVIAGTVLLCTLGGAAWILGRGQPGITSKAISRNTPASSRPGNPKVRKRTGHPPEKTTVPQEIRTGAGAQRASSDSPFPEELAGRYSGITSVGRGGFAIVYSAYRISDNRKIAVKIPIRHDEQTGKTFLNEVSIWERLHHKNIVAILAVNIFPVPFVEMEYVPGSLEELPKPLPVVTATRIIRDVTLAIRYAHEHRCIHRDIKPHNILLTDDNVPKITDWGISKMLEDRVNKTTIAGFSLMYAAPEQIAPEHFGPTNERTDIYQIGAVFYELVTGSIPFGGESMLEMVNTILSEEPVTPSEYNPDAVVVDEIILRCLAKDPADRYQSANELLDDLQEILDNTSRNDPAGPS